MPSVGGCYFCRCLGAGHIWLHPLAHMQRHHRTILDLKQHESARTIAFSDPALAGKLTAMGVLPGTRIELVRRAPFGQAYYIKADGVRLALREEEAASIMLEV